jgi:dinuclear metal center YbgI/SA1388 family protein
MLILDEPNRLNMKIREIANFIESFAPPGLQEPYDNVGLLIGDAEQDVEGALISLDLTGDVLDEAIAGGFGLIITHHPLIFGELKRITGSTAQERMILKAIRNDIAIYAAHTNLDNVHHGVNAVLSEKLGIADPAILLPAGGKLFKLVTFVPSAHAAEVREALFRAGAGHIGNYDSCSYNLDGVGTFRAGEGTDPFVGAKGVIHYEKETRIEVVFPEHLTAGLVSSLLEAHPYEEVAYDLYPLKNDYALAGSGMVGVLAKAIDERSFLEHLREVLGIPILRHSGFTGRNIKKVAVCGGSGSFLIGKALAAGADAFVTADIKYHQFFGAEGRMLIVDAGHYETEQFTKELLYGILKEKFPTFALRISQVNTNAVHYL